VKVSKSKNKSRQGVSERPKGVTVAVIEQNRHDVKIYSEPASKDSSLYQATVVRQVPVHIGCEDGATLSEQGVSKPSCDLETEKHE